MKKLFILMLLMNFATLSFAQTKATNKTTPKKPKIEDVLNQQVEMLNARIDSMTVVHTNIIAANAKYIDSMTIAHNNAIELVRNEQKEHYANYYNQLDSDFDRWLVYMSIFWTVIGVILGGFVPFRINKNFEANIKHTIEKLESDISTKISTIDDTTNEKMRHIGRITVNRIRMRYNDIDQQLKKLNDEASSLSSMKEQLENIKTKIETSERNAKESQKQAMISRLFSEALNAEKKDKERAIYLYGRIISIDNNYLAAYNNRAILYFDTDKYDNAINDASRIIEIDNSYASAYAIRAMSYARLDKINEAIEDLTKCITYSDGQELRRALICRADVYLDNRQWNKSIDDYDSADKISPLESNQQNNRAYAYYNLNKYDIAEKDALEAISKCTDKVESYAVYDTLGCIYVAKEMYSDALDCFNKAIELKPDLWETYENRANLYKKFIDIAETVEEKAKYKDLYEQDIEIVRTKKVKKDDEDEE